MESGDNELPAIPPGIAPVVERLSKETGCNDWRLAGSPLDRRECRIFFLESDTFRLPGLVLKKYKPKAVQPDLAKNLYEKLAFFHKASTPECSVPEPILLAQGKNSLVMEYIKGSSSGSILTRYFYSKNRKHHVIQRAARWLRWFHDTSGVNLQPFTPAPFTRQLKKKVKRAQKLAPGIIPENGPLSEWLELAISTASGLEGLLLPQAAVHEDFTPFNLFLQKQRTVGFDFGAHRQSPIHFDISRFLLYLDVYKLEPTPARELKQYGGSLPNHDSFMDAYGASIDSISTDVWLKIHFMEVTRRLVSLKLLHARGRGRALRQIEMAVLRRRARVISRAIS